MQDNLAATLAFILEDEGSDLNLGGSEPGGGSKYGVSMTALADWCKANGKPSPTIDDLAAMTPDEASEIYTANFAHPIAFDQLPAGVDYRLLDICVNLGVTGGIKLLQVVLGLWQTSGTMDAATLGAVNAADAKHTVVAIGCGWLVKKHESPNWQPSPVTASGYGHGWTNRMLKANRRALAMIKG